MAVSATWSEPKAESAMPRPQNSVLKESIHYVMKREKPYYSFPCFALTALLSQPRLLQSSPAPRSKNSFRRLFFTTPLSSPSRPSSFTNTQYSLSPSHLSDNHTLSSSLLRRHHCYVALAMPRRVYWLGMRLVSRGTTWDRRQPIGITC